MRKIILNNSHADPFNYLCIPFQMSNPEKLAPKVLEISALALNFILLLFCVGSYVFIIVFLYNHSANSQLKTSRNTTAVYKRLAVRMFLVAVGMCMAWVPVLIVQSLIIAGLQVSREVFLWMMFIFFPFNLIIDPIFLIKILA